MRKTAVIDILSIAVVLAVALPTLPYRHAGRQTTPSARSPVTIANTPQDDAPKYQVKDLGVPSDATFFAGIAASSGCGSVIGYAGKQSGDETVWRPVLWKNGTFSDLAYDEDYGVVRGVNDTGKVVGEVYGDDELPHAVVWEKGKAKRLFTEEYEISFALGVDNKGNILGTYLAPDSDNLRAFIRTPRGTTVYFDNKERQDSVCVGANDKRQFLVYLLDHATNTMQAMIWDRNGVRKLPPFTEDQRSFAFSINNNGTVAGSCYTSEDTFLPVLWKNAKPDILPIPRMKEAVAYRVNDNGDVIGGAILKNKDEVVPYLWKQEQFYNLNDIVEKKTSLSYAIQISSQGTIIAGGNIGRQPHTFLLQPK